VEATLTTGMSQSSDEGRQISSRCHSSAASNLIYSHIQTGAVYGDALLGAIFTMAFSERLQLREMAWHAHVQGFAAIMRARLAQGMSQLPLWLMDLLTL
jgi:hypothetical protein